MNNLNEKLSNEAQSQPSCLGAVISRLFLTDKLNLYEQIKIYRRIANGAIQKD
jgi:hypothetical protein